MLCSARAAAIDKKTEEKIELYLIYSVLKVGVLRDSHNLTLTFIFEWHLAPASEVTGELTLPF
jgi:hypothetical protein